MKISKRQLRSIIKEEISRETFHVQEGNMRDLPTVMNMLRGNNKQNQYNVLERMPAEMLISVASKLGIDIINLIQGKLAT